MSERKSNQEIGLPTVHAKDIAELAVQAATAFEEQVFVIDVELWKRKGESDQFLFEILQRLYGSSWDWDRATIGGEPILQLVRRINSNVHETSRTKGGAKYYADVAASQGGAYCVACGSNEPLEVDHIVPVSRGGHPSRLDNLQLLCKLCNLGKHNLSADLVPTAMITVKTAAVSPRIRFKRLQMDGENRGSRRVGACRCGATAADSELHVLPIPKMAANLVNLRVACSNCIGAFE